MKCQNCGTEIQEQAKFCPKCGSKVEQPIAVKVPVSGSFPHNISNIWPEWQIEKQLGKGSYGVVYQAIRCDNNVESHAAIKIISIPSDSSEVDSLRSEGLDMDGTRTYFKGIVDDFVSEIQLMESLKGIQNIVSVEDYKVVEKTDTIGWDIYIRMELLTPFNTYICDKTLTEEQIIKLGTDICTALEICGQRNIIHRDIKPENIFINDFGYFKLGDFGIARKLENMTGGLSQKGTYNYMAPEVANSNEYDARVDTYSLGIVLYRLLNNNKLPFLDTDKQLLNPNERKLAVERRMRGEELSAPCNASKEMANLILRACAYDPAERFASATEMKQALASVVNGTYVPVPINSEGSGTRRVRKAPETSDKDKKSEIHKFGDKPVKRKGKKAKIIAISVLSVILVLGITFTVLFFTGSPYSIYKDMQDQKYSSATSEYRREVKDSFFDELILGALLNGEADRAVEKYNSGEWDYYTAKEHLDALIKMEFDEASDKLNELSDSYATDIVLNFNNGELTFEKTIDELNALSESGYESATTKKDEITETYANSISTKYKNGELSFDEATSALYGLKADGYVKADDLIAEITAIENSNIALDKGNEYYENGDYEEAIKELSKIPEDSENYEEAQVKLDQAYTAYINSTVETINKYNTQKKYKEAVQYANAAYDILPDEVDTSKLDTAKEESLTAYKTEISNKVTKLTSESKYSEAFDVIDEAISFDDNEYFQTLKTTTEENYITLITNTVNGFESSGDYVSAIETIENADDLVKSDPDFIDKLSELKDSYKAQVISNADSALKSKGYKEAIQIIEDGLDILSNDSELIAKIDEYEEYKPVHLSELVATKREYCSFSETEWDPRNVLYTNVLYLISHSSNLIYHGGQIEVFTNKQYSTFSCTIVPEADFTTSSNSGSMIKIYGDGELLYTSELITYKTSGVNVNIDITNVEYLEINIENIYRGIHPAYADTLICDPYVSK